MSHRRQGSRQRQARPSVRPLEPRQLLAAPAFDAFPLPSALYGPKDIVAGPEGNLWFDEVFRGVIGRITTSGAVTEFTLPTPISGNEPRPADLISGPGGDLRFFDEANLTIGKITVEGKVTEYPVPGLSYDSGSLASGADGNVWFSYQTDSLGVGTGAIGRITPDGQVARFSLPGAGDVASSLVAGPGGNVWFLDLAAGKVGSITPDGAITEIVAPAPSGQMVVGPDGDLWYVSQPYDGGTSFVRLGPDGQATSFPVGALYPYGLAAGPDGGVDFVSHAPDGTLQIGRIDHDGVITETPIIYNEPVPSSLAAGPDGNLWVAEDNAGIIGRLDLVASTPAPSPVLVGSGLDPTVPATETGGIDLSSFRYSVGGSVTSATIDWGDGTAPEAGSVSLNLDRFPLDPYALERRFVAGTVSGTHAYAIPGTYHATVTVVGLLADGSPSTLIVDAPVSAVDPTPAAIAAPAILAGAGYAFGGVGVGTFKIPFPHDPDGDRYTATIDWGDGTAPTTGVVFDPLNAPTYGYGVQPGVLTVNGPGDPLAISGGHTYARAGTFSVRATLTDAFGYSATATTSATVVVGPLALAPVPAFTPLEPIEMPSFPFTNPYTIELGHLADFRGIDESTGDTVAIDWGDGTAPTPGAVSYPVFIYPADAGSAQPPPGLGGYLSVTGRHLFAQAGTFTARVTVTDPQGDSASTTTTVTVAGGQPPPAIRAEGADREVAVDAPLAGLGLGSFSVLDNTRSAADFTATVDWGDGSPGTTASIVADPGNPADLNLVRYDLAGEHDYAGAGQYTVTITVTGPDGTSALIPTTIRAHEGSVLNLTPDATGYGGYAGEPAGNTDDPTELATFNAPGPTASAGGYTATIDWGDGTAAAPGTIQALPTSAGGSARFSVVGFHTYAMQGLYTVHLAVQGPDGTIETADLVAEIGPFFTPGFQIPIVDTPIVVVDPAPPLSSPPPTVTETPTAAEPSPTPDAPPTPPAPEVVSLVPTTFWFAHFGQITKAVGHPTGPKAHPKHPTKHDPAAHHAKAAPTVSHKARKAVHHAAAVVKTHSKSAKTAVTLDLVNPAHHKAGRGPVRLSR